MFNILIKKSVKFMSVLFHGARFLCDHLIPKINLLILWLLFLQSLFVYGEKYNTVGDHGTITDFYGNFKMCKVHKFYSWN